MAVNFDRSYVATYLEDWLHYVCESNKAELKMIEERKEFYIPYAGVPNNILKNIFVICKRFELGLHAKYMAVHIFDRYWARLFYEIYSSHSTTSNSSKLNVPESALPKVRDKMQNQLKIAIAVSIQIASKIDLYKTALCLSQVRDLLELIDKEREYTKESICEYELRVLKALDYRLPHNLPVNVIELFLELDDLGKPELRDTCFQLLDVAYLRHNKMFEQMFMMAQGKPYDKSDPKARLYLKLEGNAPFMAASVVVCSCFFHILKCKFAEKIASKLAKLIDMDPFDVIVMANILQNFVIDDKDHEALRERQARKKASKALKPDIKNEKSVEES